MIAIKNTLVSEDLLEKKFVCDLNACKGACCVQGGSGPPVEEEEVDILKKEFKKIKPYMIPEGIDTIEKEGFSRIDEDGDLVLSLLPGKGQCAFVFFDKGIASCSVEKAHREGKIDFKKPISCHLYPVRIQKYKDYDAVNYETWNVCKPACKCGEKLQVPVFSFLKEPLQRKYGKDWYEQLVVANELRKK